MTDIGIYSSLIDAAEREGRLHIRLADIRKAFPEHSAPAINLGMARQQRRGRVVRLPRGADHWVIIPLQFAELGAPPLEAWLDEYLSKTLRLPYYVGLLSAAELYGVSPYAVMVTQVFVEKQRRPISIGRQTVEFMTRDAVRYAPIQWYETPHGGLKISSPELTVCDLVQRSTLVGGAERVLEVLKGMILKTDPGRLSETAKAFAPVPVIQRLGALLSLIGQDEWTSSLHRELSDTSYRIVDLEPSAPAPLDGSYMEDRFKVRIPIDLRAANS